MNTAFWFPAKFDNYSEIVGILTEIESQNPKKIIIFWTFDIAWNIEIPIWTSWNFKKEFGWNDYHDDGHVENHSKMFQNVNMTKTRKKNEEGKNITNSKK